MIYDMAGFTIKKKRTLEIILEILKKFYKNIKRHNYQNR